uniref:Pentatricopeptide repeat-containing protein n=1 Tax=Cannabis sativa TaxID=3483 RepID=A0A803PM24_CANSA
MWVGNPCHRSNSLISSSHGVLGSAPKFPIFGQTIELVSPRHCKGSRPLSASSSKDLPISIKLRGLNWAENARLLKSEKISALRFYNWIKNSKPALGRNYDVCSLIVDNCGRLNYYETMTCTLNEFNEKGIRLTQNAFRFIPELASDGDSLKNYVSEVVMILNGVGGMCRSSGVGILGGEILFLFL